MLRKEIASQVESITHMPSDWGDKTVITAHKMQIHSFTWLVGMQNEIPPDHIQKK